MTQRGRWLSQHNRWQELEQVWQQEINLLMHNTPQTLFPLTKYEKAELFGLRQVYGYGYGLKEATNATG